MAYEKKGYINENYHYFHLKDCEGQELDFHFHEFDKLVILLSGNVTYYIEHEEFLLKPWDILLVPHHTIHKAMIDRSTPYERIIIYINRNYLQSLIPNSNVMYGFERAARKGKYLLHPNENEKSKLWSILSEYEENTKSSSFGVNAYRDTLVLQLLIWIGRLHSSVVIESAVQIDSKIQDTLTYINEHLTEELSIDYLAERVHLSRSYFMHLFKTETKNTVHAYISQQRLLFAARKIREGVPVSVAFMESGFSDYTTFYRSFKSAFGIGPKELKAT